MRRKTRQGCGGVCGGGAVVKVGEGECIVLSLVERFLFWGWFNEGWGWDLGVGVGWGEDVEDEFAGSLLILLKSVTLMIKTNSPKSFIIVFLVILSFLCVERYELGNLVFYNFSEMFKC